MIKQQFIDYFKLFKIYDLKKLEKTGQVKIVQDKILMRKILSVQGTVSTQNFTTFICSNHPNIHFKQQYLYLLSYCQPGKALTFQITYFLASKQYKLICSTMYKQQFKKKSDSLFHFRLQMPSEKWTVLVIDLYSLVNWDNTYKNDQDIRLGFRVCSIEIRANTKIKGMFQSDYLYGPQNLPKDMEFPLRGEQMFFDKYAYTVTGLNLTQELKKQIQIQKEEAKFKEKQEKDKKNGKNEIKPDNQKPNTEKKQQNTQKSVQKHDKRNLSREKPRLSQEKKLTEGKKNIGVKNLKGQNEKKPKKQIQANFQQSRQQQDIQDLLQQQILQPPKPASSISLNLSSIQGLSLIHQNIISCESFIISPIMIQAHKKITNIYKSRLGKVLTGYQDGSVCVWDLIRKQQVFYFRSELQSIKCMIMDYEQNIVIVGLDKLKREVITIVSDQSIVFKQISTFNIKAIKLLAEETFEMGMISIGYENIRLWAINPTNNIINGYSIYLGKMARNVTYNDCCVVQTIAGTYAFICDSQGYVTKVNIGQRKMQGVVKVDQTGVDHIRLIKYLNQEQKILITNQKGTIKLLSCATMESQLQYPVGNRIKSLFLQPSQQHQQVSNLVLQSYNKTLAELDLVNSTFHFNIRSHYQRISQIELSQENHSKSVSSWNDDKIVTAGNDNTLRIWKVINVNDKDGFQADVVFKEEYEFLINGQNITHLCINSSKKMSSFVYMVSDGTKIRKIALSNYQILKEKPIPSIGNASNVVLSLSINNQGKFLLIVCEEQILIMDQELEVIQFKCLADGQNFKTLRKNKSQQLKSEQFNRISGFNSYKKSLFFQNPLSNSVQFYPLKDFQNPLFILQQFQSKVLNMQWHNQMIHCLTQQQYHLYCNENLLRVIPLIPSTKNINSSYKEHFVTMSYPILCKSFQLNQRYFVSLDVLNKNGLNEVVAVPQKINCIKLKKPIRESENDQMSPWNGYIVCSGAQSFAMYFIKFSITNLAENLFIFDDNTFELENNPVSFMQSDHPKTNKTIGIQASNISFIENSKKQNNLDISFSQTANILLKHKNFADQSHFSHFDNFSQNQPMNPPTQLKKLYEEEEKVFQQCKKAVFGNFFDNDEHQGQQNHQAEHQQTSEIHDQLKLQAGKLKLKIFFGVDCRQSLVSEPDISSKRRQEQSRLQLGKFYWSSEQKLMSLLTNEHKSLLVHQFTSPLIGHRLVHLFSKPTSICWSYHDLTYDSATKSMNYFIACHNSVIKLYNAGNKMSFIRSIESQILMKDKHVIFSSFVTNCNSFIVVLSYKIQQTAKGNKQALRSKQFSKLFIFVIELSTGKIISSSYRQIKHLQASKRFDGQKSIRETFSLVPNRFTQNRQLEFILKGSNELAFYRVTSMFTLQTLDLEEIYPLTKEKTEALTVGKYIKVEGDVFLLIGTQNGSLIIVDSRSGSIVLVLMNLLSGPKGVSNCPGINRIQFIEQQTVEGQVQVPSRLIFFTAGSNTIKVVTLQNGLNTLINEVQLNSTTIIQNQSFSNHSISSNPSKFRSINLDSEVTSVSTIDNSTQQLILTKSSTLWLVDYDDGCTIKIFSAHSQQIHEAYLLNRPQHTTNQQQCFISCSQDGYVKVTDISNIEQTLQIFKPRKRATCIQVQGSYTVCGFKDEIYFYDSLGNDMSEITYLGSLQFEEENILRIKNIPYSMNYYVLTQSKVYIIYVKRKSQSNALGKSKVSQMTKLNSSQFSLPKGQNSLEKILIEIQIQEITCFSNSEQSKLSNNVRPLWLEINQFRPYDQFSIGFRNKVETWERKCLKRTLNPLQQLSKVQQLQYYLTDVYSKKQILQPYIQFISQREYMISFPELKKLQIRNYKDHSILRQITFSEQSLQNIRTFKYLLINQKNISQTQSFSKTKDNLSISNLNMLKRGPIILIGDQFGYLNVCDMNGLVIQKEKVFNTPIDYISVSIESLEQVSVLNILMKSSHYFSLYQVSV